MEYKDPGRYIPIIFLLYSWGSLLGVPIRVPLFIQKVTAMPMRQFEPLPEQITAEPGFSVELGHMNGLRIRG